MSVVITFGIGSLTRHGELGSNTLYEVQRMVPYGDKKVTECDFDKADLTWSDVLGREELKLLAQREQ